MGQLNDIGIVPEFSGIEIYLIAENRKQVDTFLIRNRYPTKNERDSEGALKTKIRSHFVTNCKPTCQNDHTIETKEIGGRVLGVDVAP